MKRIACTLLSVFAACAAFAAKTTTWQGASGANWNVAGNWNNGIPESGDSVVLTGTDSVNDIAGLSLAGVTFSGSTGIALTGEAITLTGGESAMTFEGSGAFTVATPLVLSSGDNKVTVGTGNDVTFSGVISGAGRLVFGGENVRNDSLNNQWLRKTVWASTVRLTAVNTFTGGFKSALTTVYLTHVSSLGAEGTTVDFCGHGPLVFLEGGDIRHDFVGLDTYPWFEFDQMPVNIYGNISNDVSTSMISFLHKNAAYATQTKDCNLYGKLYYPKGSVEGGMGGVALHFHQPAAAKVLRGHSGAVGGSCIYTFHCPGNAVGTLYNSMGGSFACLVPEAFGSTTTINFTKYANYTTLDLGGEDQTIDRIVEGTAKSLGGARVITSAKPATLKMKGSANESTWFSLQGMASMEWMPTTAKTYTIADSAFTTSGRMTVSNGKLQIGANFTCAPEMSVAVGSSDMLDLQNDETYTVRALEVAGEPQWPDTYTFGTGRLLVTGYDAKSFVWTGNGETTSAAEAANWGGTTPDFSGRPYVLSFASAGAEADFGADATVLGLAFDGAATAFAVNGDGALMLNGNGVTVAADHAATIANDVTFDSVAQQIDVGEGASLTTTGEIGSALPLAKSGVGTWIVGGGISLAQGLVLNGGKVAFTADASVSLTVAADTGIELVDDAVLSLDALARLGEAKLSVVAGSFDQVVSDALKGATAPTWFTINGKRVSFGADGKAMEYDYGDGTDIPAHGGVIADTDGVVRIATNGTGEDGITLDGESVSVGALAQKATANVTVPLDGGTLTAGTLARLAGAGSLVIGSTAGDGTLAAKNGALVLENRDTAADLVIRSDLAPADVAVTKIREGAAVLLGSRSWSATVTIEDGAVAFSETKPRLELSKDETDPTVKLASDGSKLAIDNLSGSLAATGGVRQELSSFAVSDGKVTVRDGVGLHIGDATQQVPVAGELVITNASFSLVDPEQPIATDKSAKQIGQRAVWPGKVADGIYRVCADAVVTNKLVMGSSGCGGATYVDGGTAVLLGGDCNDETAGYTTIAGADNTQGYLEVREGATVSQLNSMRMHWGSGNGTIAVLGGTFKATSYTAATMGSSYFAFANGSGTANLFVRGGSFTCDDNIMMMDQGSGQGIITVADGGFADFQKLMRVGYAKNRDNTRGTLYNLLEGGRMQFYGFTVNATLFPAYATNSVGERVYRPVYVNMDGGTFSHPFDTNHAIFDNEAAGYSLVSRVTVFAKGATFQGDKSTKFLYPFNAPTGGGIRSIPWTVQAGFVAPPTIRIDGDGYGASAYADFDSRSGSVTNILVTSPGCDYTWAKAVVLQGTSVLAEIDCEVVENDRTGAFRFRGAASSHLLGKKWGVWTVGEILLDNPIDALTVYQESDDVLSTNTVLTLKEASNTYSAWNRYSGANVHNRLQVACVRGTAGKVTGASDGLVHAQRLALEGAGAIDFDGLTYRVEGTWEIDVADLIARQAAGDAAGQYNCSIVFADTARIVLKNADRIEELGGRVKLVKAVGEGHSITPSAHLLDDVVLPKGWKMSVGSHGISIGPETGLLLIVR